MIGALWFTIVGLLLVGMAVGGSVLQRLPLTTTMLYLAVGIALGPAGAGLMRLDPIADVAWLERLVEVAVLISLFAAGLKLRAGLTDKRWITPVRLATVAMVITIALTALFGTTVLHLPLGAAVLLGAILAPTDPVLASDVQVEHPTDQDRLRFALTGEAGLNDGTAFPFVMLGLGLLRLHDLGAFGWRWLALDVLWAVVAGLGAGWALAWAVSRLVIWLRLEKKEAVGLDDLLALGLIALAYGLALLVRGYGFLAVFAAGFALRREERLATQATGAVAPPDVHAAAITASEFDVATNRDTAPAYMAQAALGFTEQLERIVSVGIVLLLGGMLGRDALRLDSLWLVLALFLVIRPLSVLLGAPMRGAPPVQRQLAMWFGIRGIGAVYYILFAIHHGLPDPLARQLLPLVFATIATSVVVHGVSVTPLMKRYERLRIRTVRRRILPDRRRRREVL